jgi:type I restriction enzyme S subunit
VSWPAVQLRRVARFGYGNSLSDAVREEGTVPVYGSNGQVGTHAEANTLGPALVIGRKGSFGKVQYCERPVFAIDTTFYVDRRLTGSNLRWLFYVLQTMNLDALSEDVGVPGLSREKAYGQLVPLPPVSAQHTVADYLDRETARIDALIAAKRRMVALWHERRISVAHSTVVGAQLDAARQPSGVPWLGDIPRHWRMARVGSLFEVQLGRMLSAERSAGPHLWPYLRNLNVRWGSVDTADLAEMDFPPADRARYLVRAGDLLVNEGGAGIGRAAIWDGEIEEIYYQKSVHRIRPRGDVSVRWLLEWLRVAVNRHVFEVEGNLATIPHVPAEALRQYRVPCPPRDEMDTLIAELDSSVARDAAGLRATKAQIDLLTERRQALITAAVTGQLDIPEAA